MTILFDHRETRSGVPAALQAAGIAVAPEQLPAGDYIVSDRLVVERKTGADLAASIKSRRLFEQVERLSAAFSAVVLVVEGEPVHIAEGGPRRPQPRRPVDDLATVAQDVLTCLPGISTVGAERLLEHFGSLAAVFTADERELRRVPGIGPVRGGALARLFRGG